MDMLNSVAEPGRRSEGSGRRVEKCVCAPLRAKERAWPT